MAGLINYKMKDLKGETEKMAKTPKKIKRLMETTEELLTPYWFWPHYIDNNMVPRSLAESLVREADPGESPLSHSSKLSLVDSGSGSNVSIMNKKASTPCALPPNMVADSTDNAYHDIMLITRQRRSRVMEKAFSLEEYLGKRPRNECSPPLDMFRRFNSGNQGGKRSSTTHPMTVPSSPLEVNPYLGSMLNMHDFEMIWMRKGDNLEISRAEGLMKLLGRALCEYTVPPIS